jgi:hypothetical protein
MKQKAIILFLVVSLIVNYYTISVGIQNKRMLEYNESHQLHSEIYISTNILKNIGQELTMSNVNGDGLSSYTDLLRSFTYVHTSFDNYTEITDRLYKFVTRVGTNEIDIISANKVGQELSYKSQMLLQSLSMSRNIPLTENEDIKVIYKDILSILKEY